MKKIVQEAYDKVYRAMNVRNAIIRKAYPVGDKIAYEHGKNEILVVVVDHYDDRLKVRSLRDGREYWIGAYRVV